MRNVEVCQDLPQSEGKNETPIKRDFVADRGTITCPMNSIETTTVHGDFEVSIFSSSHVRSSCYCYSHYVIYSHYPILDCDFIVTAVIPVESYQIIDRVHFCIVLIVK